MDWQDTVMAKAAKLNPLERRRLAERLLDSAAPDQASEAARALELEARFARVRAGKEKVVPARRALALLRKRRAQKK